MSKHHPTHDAPTSMSPNESAGIENQIIADPELRRVRPLMQERCKALAHHLAGKQFARLAPTLLSDVLKDGFYAVEADEGTVWLADPGQEFLMPVFNTGPNAEQFVGRFRQPLNEGIVSMVYASEQSFCEDHIYRNKMQSGKMDQMLALLTCSMMVAPLVFAGRTRGVVSCVTLKRAEEINDDDPPGFSGDDLQAFNALAEVAGSLIDGHLMKLCFGVE